MPGSATVPSCKSFITSRVFFVCSIQDTQQIQLVGVEVLESVEDSYPVVSTSQVGRVEKKKDCKMWQPFDIASIESRLISLSQDTYTDLMLQFEPSLCVVVFEGYKRLTQVGMAIIIFICRPSGYIMP
jgi:hypothetical protein